jgi:hypothetical protein
MFSGVITLIISDWASLVIDVMVGGELFDCSASVILTSLKYHASHHGHSLTCHVSAIKKDTCPSHCDLYTYPDHHCSSDCPITEDTGFSW